MRITIDIDDYGRKESKILADDSTDIDATGAEAAGTAPISVTPDDAGLDYVEDTTETVIGEMEMGAVDAEFVGAGPADLDEATLADEIPEAGIEFGTAFDDVEAYETDSKNAGAGPSVDWAEIDAETDVYEEITHEEPVEDAGDNAETVENEKS
jgi:hypothetical protein